MILHLPALLMAEDGGADGLNVFPEGRAEVVNEVEDRVIQHWNHDEDAGQDVHVGTDTTGSPHPQGEEGHMAVLVWCGVGVSLRGLGNVLFLPFLYWKQQLLAIPLGRTWHCCHLAVCKKVNYYNNGHLYAIGLLNEDASFSYAHTQNLPKIRRT